MLRFQSPTRDEIHLALTSGHTFVVGPDPVEVPQMFYEAAMKNGCLPVGGAPLEHLARRPAATPPPVQTKESVIEGAMRAMLASKAENPGQFLGDGRPDAASVSKRVGFTVTAIERDMAWAAVNAQAPVHVGGIGADDDDGSS